MVGKIICPNMYQEETITYFSEASPEYRMSACGKEVMIFAGNAEVFIIH
jgi:hypothetical protein